MAEQAKPTVTVYDLTRNVPEGVSLSGLSVPKFDGANYYRQPTAQSSTIGFSTTGTRFVQFEYQLYSPGSATTGSTILDESMLSKRTFPAGKFVPTESQGAFVGSGKHTFSLKYACASACIKPPNQYWTKLLIIEDRWPKEREATGLSSGRLWLNVPNTELRFSGLGSLFFDGTNYSRPIYSSAFTIAWPPYYLPLNTSFTVYADRPFKVTTKVRDKILSVESGNTRTQVAINLSLVDQTNARSMTVQVDCLGGIRGCASLYSPNIGVQIPPSISVPPIVTGGLTLVLLGAIALLMGFGPCKRRG